MTNSFKTLPVEQLCEAEWNYKEDNEQLQAKLENNIEKNGIVQNLIVREMSNGLFEVVNGNHRLRAIKALGMVEVMCYNCGQITDSQAKRISVETNETRFKSDTDKLYAVIDSILTEFDQEDFNLTSPVTTEMLEQYKRDEDWQPPSPIIDAPFIDMGDDSDPMYELKCSECGKTTNVYKSMVKRGVLE